MNKGLLESVRKYRPREGKDPLENFITEAFAWILGNHSEFSEYFLDKILIELSIPDFGMSGNNCEWLTQTSFDGFFPDMVCISNGRAIVFENKVWAKLHTNQINNYKTYAERTFDESRVVLITASKSQHSQSADLALCWSDIHRWMSNWKGMKSDNSFVLHDFVSLLESEGLGPPAPISHEAILSYYSSVNLKSNLRSLIGRVKHKDWEKNMASDYSLTLEKQWGRLGLNLLKSWDPGIFVGVLLDGSDHRTTPISLAKGPDLCVILDFESRHHSYYPSDSDYLEFVDAVSKRVNSLNGVWEFYDHLNDRAVARANRWHPIHIRMPILDVFSGTQLSDEQDERFYANANEILEIINCEPAFWRLRDKLKKSSNKSN